MFCSNCGKELKSTDKFCPGCGKSVNAQGDSQATVTPEPNRDQQPTAKTVPSHSLDVKNIVKSPPKVMVVEESIDFKGAEHALEAEGLKTKAFSGVFSSPMPNEVRVDSLVKVYEPIHMVRAVYEGTFEVAKEFNLQLDSDTVKIDLDGKSYDIKPVAQAGSGLFGGSAAPSLKLTGTETVKKRNEKAVYYDMKGVLKPAIANYVSGKNTDSFNPSQQKARTEVLGTDFHATGLSDKVLTPDIILRQQNAKKTVSERITVDIQTIYYPKYKALVTNLKNSQQKYLIFSAVDKQVFGSETF